MNSNNDPILIGLTMDSLPGGDIDKGHYSVMEHYAIRDNYCRSIAEFGAIPVPLIHDMSLVAHYADILSGFLATGGAFDIPPSWYGDKEQHKKTEPQPIRSNFEKALFLAIEQRNKPFLGICGGMQLLNVVYGGTLIQHLPEEIDSDINHEQPNPRTEKGHYVSIKSGTLLHQIVGKNEIPVNSAHHQAIRQIGDRLVLSGTCKEDNVIEAIELPGERFCLGVQWHPEYQISEADRDIFQAFVKECANKYLTSAN